MEIDVDRVDRCSQDHWNITCMSVVPVLKHTMYMYLWLDPYKHTQKLDQYLPIRTSQLVNNLYLSFLMQMAEYCIIKYTVFYIYRGWWGTWESSRPNIYMERYQAIIEFIAKQPNLDAICLQEFWFNSDAIDFFETKLGEK
jgi:hypothetical protein